MCKNSAVCYATIGFMQPIYSSAPPWTSAAYIAACKIVPAVNQVLCHPGQTPFELIDFCKTRRIAVEAYSPIAHGEAYRIDKICDMARKYKKTVSQICIRYCMELGLVV